MSYYDREFKPDANGLIRASNDRDHQYERLAAKQLSKAWRCELGSFGTYAPLDWYFIRDGKLVGLGEVKARDHRHDKYPTVFLNLRKWLALLLGSLGMGVPAIYAIQFTDQLRWIDVSKVDARQCRMGGCKKFVKSVTDQEPVIEIPVDCMTLVEASEPESAVVTPSVDQNA